MTEQRRHCDNTGSRRTGGALLLVLTSQFSVQFGAAVADTLFPDVGVFGTVTLRIAIAAIVLLVVCRPGVRRIAAADWLVIAGFGVALASMNTLLYSALARIPLGAAVTIEVLGPLALSVAVARRAVGWLWAAVALAGVILLGRSGFGGGLAMPGVLCALGAAVMWASYIVLSQRAGRRFAGLDGLALAMSAAAVLVIPFGIAEAGAALWQPRILGLGAAVAALSSLLPYICDLTALRRMPSGGFALMMSLSPAVAAGAGALVLDQRLGTTTVLAIGLVIVANAGSVLTSVVVKQPVRRSEHQPTTGEVDGGHDLAHERDQRV